ncbi:MAG: hypothetical protein NVSMB13_03070 [Mycobacteriales bacterium]
MLSPREPGPDREPSRPGRRIARSVLLQLAAALLLVTVALALALVFSR